MFLLFKILLTSNFPSKQPASRQAGLNTHKRYTGDHRSSYGKGDLRRRGGNLPPAGKGADLASRCPASTDGMDRGGPMWTSAPTKTVESICRERPPDARRSRQASAELEAVLLAHALDSHQRWPKSAGRFGFPSFHPLGGSEFRPRQGFGASPNRLLWNLWPGRFRRLKKLSRTRSRSPRSCS